MQRQRRRGPAVELDVVVVDVVDAAVLRFLGPTDGFKVTLRWCHGVREVREWPAVRKFWRRRDSPAALRKWNFRAGRDTGAGQVAGEAPGLPAELLRGLAGLVVQRSGVAAAALRALRSGAVRARRARVWAAAGRG